ncbi:Uncharacterized protein TCM_024623 [Theobroma cacao]|uniref:Putative plant transposon protein domain-containing protein n=1 Tax=Theobroma cacao TaxID=3641 RepID=A0A061F3Z0_THECC|nr:Uncharacterized protein TCM_024623 [Theobroma cacao]
MKLKDFNTFKNRTYSASLVEEFYANVAIDKDELKDSNDYIDDGLNVYLNGKEFIVTVVDLGNLLKIESEDGDSEMPENYNPTSLWEIITERKEKYSSKSNAGLIKSLQVRILHYFIASNIHGRGGSFSYISFQDLWLMEHAFNGAPLNLGKFMIERMRGVYRLEKINLSYGNMITSLVQKKEIWSSRYELDKVKSRDQAIYLGSLPKMGYKLDGEKFVKTPKVTLGGESSLPAQLEAAPSQLSNEMVFNLLMRMDGKLTNQAVRMQKIEEKLVELKNVLKEKGKMPHKLTATDISATSSPAPVGQDAEGSAFQVEGHEPEVDQPRKSPSPKPQKEAKSEQEEVSIMVFHQMVREEQAENEAAKRKAEKSVSPKESPELVLVIKEQYGKGKEKAAAALQSKSKPSEQSNGKNPRELLKKGIIHCHSSSNCQKPSTGIAPSSPLSSLR